MSTEGQEEGNDASMGMTENDEGAKTNEGGLEHLASCEP